jgi:hypothetical protein
LNDAAEENGTSLFIQFLDEEILIGELDQCRRKVKRQTAKAPTGLRLRSKINDRHEGDIFGITWRTLWQLCWPLMFTCCRREMRG